MQNPQTNRSFNGILQIQHDFFLCIDEDVFYDAGRDRPFMSLTSYEQKLQMDSREVILIDRQRDEMLDAIARRAQALIFHFNQTMVCLKIENMFLCKNLTNHLGT